MDYLKLTEQEFFCFLLQQTKTAFAQSPIKHKQEDEGERWFYSVCGTPIRKQIGVLCGINWGAKANTSYDPQPNMITDLEEDGFPRDVASHLNNHLGITSIKEINYTNLCFFRTPKANWLEKDDWNRSIPLFHKYINYIDPPWVVFAGLILIWRLVEAGFIDEFTTHVLRPKGKVAVCYSGQLTNGKPFACVPHPRARFSTEIKQGLWAKACNSLANKQ